MLCNEQLVEKCFVKDNELILKIKIEKLREIVKIAQEAGLNKLLTINVVDLPRTKTFLLIYTLSSLSSRDLVHIKAAVPRDRPVVPSISDIYLEADYFERECHEMFGIVFEGNSECRGTFFLDKSIEGLFPLRKDRA